MVEVGKWNIGPPLSTKHCERKIRLMVNAMSFKLCSSPNQWLLGVYSSGCTLLILLLWIVLIIGVCYSCCADSYTASSILTFFMILLSLCSPILWSALYMVFTLAGHIDLVLCTPLTSVPEYRVLSKFVDESSNGNYFLSSYVYNNKSFNVPVRDVLK